MWNIHTEYQCNIVVGTRIKFMNEEFHEDRRNIYGFKYLHFGGWKNNGHYNNCLVHGATTMKLLDENMEEIANGFHPSYFFNCSECVMRKNNVG